MRVREGHVAASLVAVACFLFVVGRLPPTWAQSQQLPKIPALTGTAALADGTLSRPYEVVVKACGPFATVTRDIHGDVQFGGYHLDQMKAIHTDAHPFHLNYTLTNASYDNALDLLK